MLIPERVACSHGQDTGWSCCRAEVPVDPVSRSDSDQACVASMHAGSSDGGHWPAHSPTASACRSAEGRVAGHRSSATPAATGAGGVLSFDPQRRGPRDNFKYDAQSRPPAMTTPLSPVLHFTQDYAIRRAGSLVQACGWAVAAVVGFVARRARRSFRPSVRARRMRLDRGMLWSVASTRILMYIRLR